MKEDHPMGHILHLEGGNVGEKEQKGKGREGGRERGKGREGGREGGRLK